MKKYVTTILTALFVSCITANAGNITDNGDGKYTIQNDKVTMTVTKDGGKILSFKYGDAEVISQTTFPNSFGSTFWTSPQKEWNWPPVPEFDRMPYQVTTDDKLVMTSEVSGRLKYQIRKEFSVDPTDKAIVVGDHVWIGCKCVLLKGAEVPDNTVVAAGTLITSSFAGEHQVVGGNPPTVLKRDVRWDH